MPSTFVPLPLYPTVPPLPGVPPLPAPVGGLDFALPVLAAADTLGLPMLASTSQWGIWGSDGTPILLTDATYSVEYARDYKISDYPQISSGTPFTFQSYNKVQQPYQARVEFLISATRVAFLQNVEAAVASLALVTVVTPEIRYYSANLTHYSYQRQASNGAKLIKVEVWCEEVRVTAGAQLSSSTAAQPGTGASQANSNVPQYIAAPGSFANTQSPNGAAQSNDGVVQPQGNFSSDSGTFDASTLTPPT